MANKDKKSAEESDDSENIDVSTSNDHITDDLDKTKTIEEAINETPDSQPDEETKKMLSTDGEIDDDILAETSSNLAREENNDAKSPKKPKNWKKLFKVLLILILLAAAGFAVWYFVLTDKNVDNNSTQNVETQESVQENTNTPDAIVYAYHEKDTDPDTIYWRPANGGERTEITTLEKNTYVEHSDVFQNIVVYSTNKEISVSTDGGRTFKSIVQINDNTSSDALGDQVTSLKISRDGKRIAYGFLPENQNGQMISVDLNGQDKKELISSDKALFVEAWNASENKMVYWKGCYNCGGNTPDLQIRDLTTKKDKQIDESLKNTLNGLRDFAVTDDISTMVVAQGTPDPNAGEGLGLALIAPYTISTIDLESLEKTKVETVGTTGEKNPNGTTKYRQIIVGFFSPTKHFYFTDENNVYQSFSGVKPAVILYSAKEDILHLPFASEEFVVAGAGPQDSDYQLAHYDVSTKKSAQVFIGDSQTSIFGVSTK
jgi:hypothetical protein